MEHAADDDAHGRSVARSQHAVASSVRDGTAALFDLQGEATTASTIVATGEGAEGLAINSKTGEAWIGNRVANTLTIVGPATTKASAPINTGDFPFRITFTPDAATALVSCAESGEVQIFDSTKKSLTRSISIHGDASELSAQPMGLCNRSRRHVRLRRVLAQ